jgi:uncharacterized 2Fe-2S/4Fe-4S cluster protein (DUF4445 family)
VRRIPANGGMVMVVFYPEFVRLENPRNVTIKDVVNHIDYIKNRIGIPARGVCGVCGVWVRMWRMKLVLTWHTCIFSPSRCGSRGPGERL